MWKKMPPATGIPWPGVGVCAYGGVRAGQLPGGRKEAAAIYFLKHPMCDVKEIPIANRENLFSQLQKTF